MGHIYLWYRALARGVRVLLSGFYSDKWRRLYTLRQFWKEMRSREGGREKGHGGGSSMKEVMKERKLFEKNVELFL